MTTECTTERLEFGGCEGSESSVDLTVGSSAQMVADCCCGSWRSGRKASWHDLPPGKSC